MNIDLLITPRGEAGLIGDMPLPSAVAGVMFDPPSCSLTLEFAEEEPFPLNIPVAEENIDVLVLIPEIYIGVILQGQIAESTCAPLIRADLPFGSGGFPMKPETSVSLFEAFLKRTETSQPVHRENLENELSAGSVFGEGGIAGSHLAPHLAQQMSMEKSMQAQIAAQYGIAGPAPGMGPGGSGGGHGSSVVRKIQQPQNPPPRDTSEED